MPVIYVFPAKGVVLLKKIDLKIVASVTAAIIIVYLSTRYWPNIAGVLSSVMSAATPIIFGFVVAYPINILLSFYERHFFPKSEKGIVLKLRKPVCLLAAVVSIIGVVALVTPTKECSKFSKPGFNST